MATADNILKEELEDAETIWHYMKLNHALGKVTTCKTLFIRLIDTFPREFTLMGCRFLFNPYL